MKRHVVVFTLAALTALAAVPAFAALPFETYFGNYKVLSCRYELNGYPIQNDPECGYSHIQVGQDENGVVRVTRSTNHGSSVSEPVELFDRSQDGVHDEATLYVYGNCQAWTHTLARPDGTLNQEIEITSFVFNLDQNSKVTFMMNQSVQGRHGNDHSHRTFELVRE